MVVLPELAGARRVVLVEGESDAAAVRTTAAALDVDLADVAVVAMGGATNIRHYLVAVQRIPVSVGGLCDAREARGFRRALQHVGLGTDLAAAGFYVCDADLEDEFVRSIGPEQTRALVEQAGEGGLFDTFSRQPAQRERPLSPRLRRFLGTQSGRKIRYGTLLAAAAAPDHVPAPLRALLADIAGTGRS